MPLVLRYEDLKAEFGEGFYTREHLARMEEQGLFPKRYQLAPGGVVVWNDAEVRAWHEQRKAAPLVNTRQAPPVPQPKRHRRRALATRRAI